jgi:thiol-disulfide isomerase/thioredoxin
LDVLTSSVVDCHQHWCGPCEAVMPTFQRLFLDYPNAEKRLGIANVAIDHFKPSLQAILPHDAHVDLNKIGCLPLFLLIKSKACVAVIQGVDTPGISQQVAMNIPENKSTDDM